MANTVRILRSTTAGAVPASLVSGQIAINENDGRLYYRSAAGVVTQFSAGATSVVEYATTASFPGTGSSAVLYLATDTRRIYSWTGNSYAEIGAVSSYDSRWDLFLPPAPTGVSGTATSGQVALTWTAPTVLSQTPITDYVVQYSSNGGSTWTTFSDGTSASASATVTGLTNGTAYTFRVAAVNAIGTGAYSSASGSVTPAGAFTPPGINGLALWLDAADANTLFDATSGGSLVAANGGVARWEDKSGNGRHVTQSTAGNRPTRKTNQQNGLDTLLFDGSNDSLVGGDYLDGNTGSVTTFVVLKRNATNANHEILGKGTDSGGWMFRFVAQNKINISAWTDNTFGNSTAVDSTNTFTATSYALAFFSFTAGSFHQTTYRRNGSSFAANAASEAGAGARTPPNTSDNFRIGTQFYQGVDYFLFNGNIAEIIIYNSALSDANRALVENYLIAKWGIA